MNGAVHHAKQVGQQAGTGKSVAWNCGRANRRLFPALFISVLSRRRVQDIHSINVVETATHTANCETLPLVPRMPTARSLDSHSACPAVAYKPVRIAKTPLTRRRITNVLAPFTSLPAALSPSHPDPWVPHPTWPATSHACRKAESAEPGRCRTFQTLQGLDHTSRSGFRS